MDNERKYFFAMIKTDGGYYIACDTSGVLTVRNSMDDFVKEFEAVYELALRKGYTGKSSAIIHNTLFQPSVIEMTINDLSNTVFDLKAGTQVNKVNSPAGGFTGLYCNSKNNLDEIFQRGIKPKLGLL